MLRTRWQKVFIDLWRNRARTAVVALAIAVGVYAVGGVLNTQELMIREFEKDQAGARLAHAIVRTTPFNDAFVRRVAEIPGVAAAEGRHVARGRTVETGGEWHDLTLVSVADFTEMNVDAVTPLQGAVPPQDGEIVLERLSLPYLELAVGDPLAVEMDNGAQKTLTVSGTVHDPQQLTPDILGDAVGYVTPETMGTLGETQSFTELRMRVTGDAEDRPYVEAVVDRVEAQVEDSGRPVLNSAIPERFIRPIINTLLMILSTFGATVMLLSGFLVVNAISALVTQQIQQIGIMKLVGARRRQIISLYLLTVLVYGAIAVAIGLPLSVASARYFMTWRIEEMLNVVPESYAIPLPLLSLQVFIGLLLPVVAGLIPAWRGTRITTFEALNDVGVKGSTPGRGPFSMLVGKLQELGLAQRPLVLAIRNTLRHRGRLAQTLFVLIAGTALFIAVLTVRTSVDETIRGFLRFHQYDVSIRLNRPLRTARLEQIAMDVPGVVAVESWSVGSGARVRPDDSQSSAFPVHAVPPDTALMSPRIDAGRWLQADDEGTVVINSDVVEDEPDLTTGSDLVLEIAGRQTTWRVVGIVPTVARGPAVYVPYNSYTHVTRTPGQTNSVQVISDRHDAASQETVEKALFQAYEAAGISVSGTRTTQQIRSQNELSFNLVIIFLVIMALLLAAVGALGLTTTMSINVLERIREIGVLRAIGASNVAVGKIVVAEGVVIGLFSWGLGTLLSVPVGILMSDQVGLALLDIPLTYRYSTMAAILWFFALMGIAVAASLGPARNAVRLTVREVLAYE